MISSTAMTKLDRVTAAEPEAPLGYRPLYRQVRELLVRRLAEGVWQPGQLLPSEGQLAAELGVSQGTVRKALDSLTAERLLVRRQGRGTFDAELPGEPHPGGAQRRGRYGRTRAAGPRPRGRGRARPPAARARRAAGHRR